MDEKYIDKEEQFYNDVINGVIELVDIPEGEIHISEEEAIRLQNIGISIHSNEYLLAEFQAIQEALLEEDEDEEIIQSSKDSRFNSTNAIEIFISRLQIVFLILLLFITEIT